MANNYKEKLKNPRWQKKRLEIFNRDHWTCQRCFTDDIPLNIHHRKYLPNTDPWDYPNELLITLCEECHDYETLHYETALATLIDITKTYLLADDIAELIPIVISLHDSTNLDRDQLLEEDYTRRLETDYIKQANKGVTNG